MLLSASFAAISAALYSASFPPLSQGWLVWIALAPLLVACARVSPPRAFALGLLWGGLMALGVGWCLPDMLVAYFGVARWYGWLGFLAVAIGSAGIYFGIFGGAVSWLARRERAGPWLIGAAWVGCELMRATLLVGNPWALSGYSQVGFLRLIQIADLAGPYGIGVLIAAVNATLAGWFSPRLRSPTPVVSLMSVGVALVAALVYGQVRLSTPFATGDPMRIAVVQGAAKRGAAWRPEYAARGFDRYVDLSREAARAAPALIVWPEQAVNFYPQEAGREQAQLLALSREVQADFIVGAPHYSLGESTAIYHNSAFLLRAGRIRGRYDKNRLLPLAEATLFGAHVPGQTSYASGSSVESLAASSSRVGAFVCFEAMYPEYVRSVVDRGADLLTNLSNDVWFGHPSPARHHLEMSSLRAIESRRFLIRAASTGYSALIDPHGRIVEVSRFDEPDIVSGEVYRSNAVTLYQRWGDAPLTIFVCATAVWAGVGARKTRRRRARRSSATDHGALGGSALPRWQGHHADDPHHRAAVFPAEPQPFVCRR